MSDYKLSFGENHSGNIDTEQMLMNQIMGDKKEPEYMGRFNEQDSNNNVLSSFNKPPHLKGPRSVLSNITARDEDIIKYPNKVNISEKNMINQGFNFNRGAGETFSMASYSPKSSANDATLNPNKNFENSQALDPIHRPLIFPIGESLGNLTEIKLRNEPGNAGGTNINRRERQNNFVTTGLNKLEQEAQQPFLRSDGFGSRGKQDDNAISEEKKFGRRGRPVSSTSIPNNQTKGKSGDKPQYAWLQVSVPLEKEQNNPKFTKFGFDKLRKQIGTANPYLSPSKQIYSIKEEKEESNIVEWLQSDNDKNKKLSSQQKTEKLKEIFPKDKGQLILKIRKLELELEGLKKLTDLNKNARILEQNNEARKLYKDIIIQKEKKISEEIKNSQELQKKGMTEYFHIQIEIMKRQFEKEYQQDVEEKKQELKKKRKLKKDHLKSFKSNLLKNSDYMGNNLNLNLNLNESQTQINENKDNYNRYMQQKKIVVEENRANLLKQSKEKIKNLMAKKEQIIQHINFLKENKSMYNSKLMQKENEFNMIKQQNKMELEKTSHQMDLYTEINLAEYNKKIKQNERKDKEYEAEINILIEKEKSLSDIHKEKLKIIENCENSFDTFEKSLKEKVPKYEKEVEEQRKMIDSREENMQIKLIKISEEEVKIQNLEHELDKEIEEYCNKYKLLEEEKKNLENKALKIKEQSDMIYKNKGLLDKNMKELDRIKDEIKKDENFIETIKKNEIRNSELNNLTSIEIEDNRKEILRTLLKEPINLNSRLNNLYYPYSYLNFNGEKEQKEGNQNYFQGSFQTTDNLFSSNNFLKKFKTELNETDLKNYIINEKFDMFKRNISDRNFNFNEKNDKNYKNETNYINYNNYKNYKNYKNDINPLLKEQKYQRASPFTDLSTPEIQKRLKEEIESSELDG